MSDRELLELAAKAAGYSTKFGTNVLRDKLIPPIDTRMVECIKEQFFKNDWNPLIYDADAISLAVRLKIDIEFLQENDHEGEVVTATKNNNIHSICCFENTAMNSDLLTATRRAIVRAAAEIGKTL